MRQKKSSQAIAEFEVALENAPNFLPVYISLGELYNKTGDYDKALAICDKLRRFAPPEEDLAEASPQALSTDRKSWPISPRWSGEEPLLDTKRGGCRIEEGAYNAV